MKVNLVRTTYKRIVQMRQYEPVEVTMTIEAQVDPNDKVATVIADIKHLAKQSVEEEIIQLKKIRKQSYEDELEKSI